MTTYPNRRRSFRQAAPHARTEAFTALLPEGPVHA